MIEFVVKIEERLIGRIGVREWGLPTLRTPGKIWRSKRHKTVSCMVPSADPDKVSIETARLEVLPIGELTQMPLHWVQSLWEYVQAWPDSGAGLGPFLAITQAERAAFIRQQARRLETADDFVVASIAHQIGQLAAYEYEVVEPDYSKQ